jgi:hypothetical protein
MKSSRPICSAELHSAVSPTCSRQGVFKRSAECNSAVQQSKTLCYRRKTATRVEAAAHFKLLNGFSPGAAPGPVFGGTAQTGLDWIIQNIAATPCMLVVIANPVIEGFRLPERLAGAAKNLVRLACCISFPALQNDTQFVVRHRPEHGMNMVWHHNPCAQKVSFIFEMPDCSGNQVRNFRTPQPAFTRAFIQIRFHFAVIVPLDCLQVVNRLNTFGQFFRGLLVGTEASQSVSASGLNFKKDFFGKRIRQTKSDKVTRSFAFHMRQISSSVNSRPQRVSSFGIDAGGAQFISQPFPAWILLFWQHVAKIRLNAERRQHFRSAELHSAVSPTCSRQGVRQFESRGIFKRSAECNSAIQQSKTLRYDKTAPSNPFRVLKQYYPMRFLPESN